MLGSGCRAIPLGKSNVKREKMNLGNRLRSRTLTYLPAKGTRLFASLGQRFSCFRAAMSANTPRMRGQERVLTPSQEGRRGLAAACDGRWRQTGNSDFPFGSGLREHLRVTSQQKQLYRQVQTPYIHLTSLWDISIAKGTQPR